MGASPSPWPVSRSGWFGHATTPAGESTRVRVPPALPARAVRRVVCDSCHQPFECDGADDVGVVEPHESAGNRLWKYLSIPLAAAAVIVALILIQGSGSDNQSSSPATAAQPPAGGAPPANAAKDGRSSKGGELVKGSSYTLALPHGWTQTEPQNGQTFAASADGGAATAALWVERDPKLTFPQFESQSLAQLRRTAGSAQVTGRISRADRGRHDRHARARSEAGRAGLPGDPSRDRPLSLLPRHHR